LVGRFEPSLAGSELAKLRGEAPSGPLPPADAAAIGEVLAEVREAVRSGRVHSAHDVADGGVAVALAECCVGAGIGAVVELPEGVVELFGEAPGRAFIVSGPREALAGLPVIGRVGGSELEIVGQLKVPVKELTHVRDEGLATLL
jgi:phosphoribosylformylglycinamidine (FGAM) synthase-like enzyme